MSKACPGQARECYIRNAAIFKSRLPFKQSDVMKNSPDKLFWGIFRKRKTLNFKVGYDFVSQYVSLGDKFPCPCSKSSLWGQGWVVQLDTNC